MINKMNLYFQLNLSVDCFGLILDWQCQCLRASFPLLSLLLAEPADSELKGGTLYDSVTRFSLLNLRLKCFWVSMRLRLFTFREI